MLQDLKKEKRRQTQHKKSKFTQLNIWFKLILSGQMLNLTVQL